jgi:hypothetical protein
MKSKFEIEKLNPKLETLNSKQTQNLKSKTEILEFVV